MRNKPIILILLGHYLPGFRSGGPIQSIEGLVYNLGDEYDFRIITSDHDYGMDEPYCMIEPNKWVRYGKGSVYYISSKVNYLSTILRLLRETRHDLLYLNSLCTRTFAIFPLWAWYLRFLPHVPIILAPRGELSPPAFRHNYLIKRAYVLMLKIAGIHKRVVWQASSVQEKTDIQRTFRRKASITLARDMKVPISNAGPLKQGTSEPDSTPKKTDGQLAIVYLARIHPHKNLLFALSLLKGLRGNVLYDIYGPLEDIEYWAECKKVISNMPPNIVVRYEGELAHEKVPNYIKKYHVLFLPSKSENFGHSIVESLLGGLPVVISDRTPWQSLHESNAGWDIPLSEPNLFISKLQHLIDMGEEDFNEMRKGARSYAKMKCTADTIIQQNRALVSAVLSGYKI